MKYQICLSIVVILMFLPHLLFSQEWKTVQNIKGLPDGDFQVFESASFSSPNIAWIVGTDGLILRSDDSGSTWKLSAQYPGHTFESIVFANSQLGLIGGHVNSDNDMGKECIILRTTTEGQKWSLSVIGKGQFEFCTVTDLYFLDESNGWGTGYVQLKGAANALPLVLKTVNGGESWSYRTPHTQTESLMLTGVVFVDNSYGFAAGTKGIYGTNDGGENWTLLRHSKEDLSFWSIRLGSKASVWAVGSDGNVLFTSDKGKVWNEVELGSDLVSYWYSDILFTSDQVGYLVGGFGGTAVVLGTVDGGKSWIVEAKVDGYLKSLAHSQGRIIGVGSDGLILFRQLPSW